VEISVTAVDDPPTAVPDSVVVTEDVPTPVDLLANDADIDGGPKTIISATAPSNGSVAITGGGAGLTYTPAPNFCARLVHLHLQGGRRRLGDDISAVAEDSAATAVDVAQ
jgi:hypothetical protein